MLISTSVCKDHLEPSVACAVHNGLGLAPSCLNFDVGNACLGFINGMQIAAAAIDAGSIDYALIVDGEGSRYTQQTTIERLQRPDATANDVFAEFASLTLGSGAAAAVLCRLDRHPEAHRLVGGIARSATQHNELCIGDLDRMRTDSHGLMIAGLDLAEAAWKHSGHDFDWEVGMDHYIVHQVSQRHTDLLCERLGIDPGSLPAHVPGVRQRRPRRHSDHAGVVPGPDRGRRTRAVHGDRFRPQHELHRNRLVTGAPDQPDGATWRAWGIDPSWSRMLDVRSHDGDTHRWHVLDTGPGGPGSATIVCVHGNPTWAYAWKSFLTRFGAAHRVIAIDQLGMGYSERLDESHRPRRYRERVADLGDLIGALDLDADSPLVLAAHDWGGAIAMGWAVQHTERVAGMVLCNTGIGVPEGRGAPKIIRLARSAPLRDLVCRRTPIFVEGTVRLSGRRISRIDRTAFRAPYRSADRRGCHRRFRRRRAARRAASVRRSADGSGRPLGEHRRAGAAGLGLEGHRVRRRLRCRPRRPLPESRGSSVSPMRITSSWPRPTWRARSTSGCGTS